jgi:hypothetical protein
MFAFNRIGGRRHCKIILFFVDDEIKWITGQNIEQMWRICLTNKASS